jgi:hypothetical protein
MNDLWQQFYEDYPEGAYCPECNQPMYVSDPPHSIYCENIYCNKCPDSVRERKEELEYYEDDEDEE